MPSHPTTHRGQRRSGSRWLALLLALSAICQPLAALAESDEEFMRTLNSKQRELLNALPPEQRSKVIQEMKRLRAEESGGSSSSSSSSSKPTPSAPSSDDDGGSIAFEPGVSLLQGYSVAMGAFVEGGNNEYSDYRGGNSPNPVSMGFRYYERNGFISGTIAAIAIAVGGAAAASGPKSVESWESGGYRYTRTTYYSPAERAAMTAATSAAAAGAFSIANQSFDLQVFTRHMGGNTEGYKLNMLFGIPFADGHGMFDLGFGLGNVRSAVGEDGKYLVSQQDYLGMPMRLSGAFGPLVTFLQFEWNWMAHTDDADNNKPKNIGTTRSVVNYAHPWRLGVQAAIFGYLFAEAGLTTPSITSGSIGFTSTLGARF